MEKKVKWSPNPRHVDYKATEVEMNGTRYFRADSVCAERWPYLQQYEAQLIHGKRADELYKVLKNEMKPAVQKADFMETAVILHNLINDTANITQPNRLPAAFAITMLFWNYEDEDVGAFDQAVMEKKMTDARKSGIDAAFFFAQPARCIQDYLALLDPLAAQGIGSKEKEIQQPLTNPVLSKAE